ncbi:hypothetical protein [Burkholderia diffusa]|uniref:hypothetical protein n=1 Tax=Burkholderia diffusa TaxID=488732 RepID=UPI000757203A|nr:hypothetical protein [Burkholderia diffusa]KVC45186.1 hypothetical protein WI71_15340 [Burkholderia diffusa]
MKRAWEITQLTFVWLLIAIATFALFRLWAIIARSVGSQKDFWDIASGIGTCGAVVAALYIASSENRKKNRAAFDEARITAATVTFRVGTAIAAVRTVKATVAKALTDDIQPKAIPAIAAPLERLSRFSSDELRSLMPLPNYCSENIAAGYDRIFIATMFLQKEAEKRVSTRQSREQCFQMVRRALAEAHEMLTRAGATLEQSTVQFRNSFDDVSFD